MNSTILLAKINKLVKAGAGGMEALETILNNKVNRAEFISALETKVEKEELLKALEGVVTEEELLQALVGMARKEEVEEALKLKVTKEELSKELAKKANASSLANKAEKTHTHTLADIQGFDGIITNEIIDQIVANALNKEG